MDSFVLAVREDSHGAYIGFLADRAILACTRCDETVKYRLRYTENEHGNLAKHRQRAQHLIEAEHPEHSDKIRVG